MCMIPYSALQNARAPLAAAAIQVGYARVSRRLSSRHPGGITFKIRSIAKDRNAALPSSADPGTNSRGNE
jgi:hypothetical protein